MLPVVIAAVSYGPPLLVFLWDSMPFRTGTCNEKRSTETYDDLLPRGVAEAMHDEVNGVDTDNFLIWAKLFADSVSDLTAGRQTQEDPGAGGTQISYVACCS